jgi:peptidyl-tRNA hydrolase
METSEARSIHADTRIWLALIAALACFLSRAEEPYKEITQQQIDAITYEDCEDDDGVTFPFFADFERATTSGEDRKKSFDEWKEKLENWDANGEQKIGQKVRNFISLMALVDILQMEFEGETPKILFDRMKKEIPKEDLIKAAAWCALKPDDGTIVTKCADLGIEDGAAEDRVRERVSTYGKKVLGRLLGKLPPKQEEPLKAPAPEVKK